MNTPKERYEAIYERPAEERRKLERDRDALLAAAKDALYQLTTIEITSYDLHHVEPVREALRQAIEAGEKL